VVVENEAIRTLAGAREKRTRGARLAAVALPDEHERNGLRNNASNVR